MPFYFVTVKDKDGALDERLAHRQEHVDYWAARTGVVKVAGAILTGGQPSGSALLIEAADEAAARTLVERDPFMTRGVFSSEVEVLAIRPAIGEWFVP